jgi:hypothetical protein
LNRCKVLCNKNLHAAFSLKLPSTIECPLESSRSFPMIHKGVEYTVTLTAPGVWKWQFRIGDKVKTGKTEAKLHLLAIRRVQLRIDRELKKAGQEQVRDASDPGHS